MRGSIAENVATGSVTSAALARQAGRGDQGAVAELYRRTWPRALATVRASCGPDEAEDAVAEGFAHAFARLDQIRDPAAVEAWLTRSAIRASLDLARKRHRMQPGGGPTDLPAPAGGPARGESAADRAERVLDRDALSASVGQLPADLRRLVWLRYGAGLSVREVAAELSWPEGTVRRRCFDARRLLRQRYLHHHLRPATGECGPVTDELCRAASRELSPLARHRVERHLLRCLGCRERQAELAALTAATRLRVSIASPPARAHVAGLQPR